MGKGAGVHTHTHGLHFSAQVLCEMFDLEIMIAIGSALLITSFVLIGVVICLYYKVANTIK